MPVSKSVRRQYLFASETCSVCMGIGQKHYCDTYCIFVSLTIIGIYKQCLTHTFEWWLNDHRPHLEFDYPQHELVHLFWVLWCPMEDNRCEAIKVGALNCRLHCSSFSKVRIACYLKDIRLVISKHFHMCIGLMKMYPVCLKAGECRPGFLQWHRIPLLVPKVFRQLFLCSYTGMHWVSRNQSTSSHAFLYAGSLATWD